MQLSNKTRLQLKIQKFIFLFLFISSIALLAWLSNHYTKQFDLTSNQRHSLSDNSIDLLHTLDDKVVLYAYVNDTSTQQAVSVIIKRYQQIKNDFELNFLNPDIDFEQAKRDDVVLNNNIAFVLHYKNRHENISSLSENTISNALLRLNKKNQSSVLFLSGHNERDPFDKTNRGYAKLTKTLKNRGVNVDVINLLQTPLDTQNTILVIGAPDKPLLDGEVTLIQNYLKNGGNLLWLNDVGNEESLQSIAQYIGIHFPKGVIVDNNTNLRQTLKIKHPAIIPVIEYPEHIITQRLNYTLFPIARGIEITAKKDQWLATPILQSLAKSWLETGGILGDIIFESGDGDIAGPITLGVTLERKVLDSHDDKSKPATQRIAVIGDSDFLANSNIGAGDNLNLGINIFNWLSNNDDLLTIAPKARHDLKLDLNDTQLAIISFGFFLILPAILLITGLLIWYLRKKR